VAYLNRALREALGWPEAVEVLVDETEKLLAFRPVADSCPTAFSVSKLGVVQTRRPVRLLLSDLPTERRRYEVRTFGEEGLVGEDLKEPGVVVAR
jgi:hypothetical protein